VSPRRGRGRRRTSTDPLADLQRRVDAATGGQCTAVQLRSVDGTPAMLLMGDGCAACTAFRAQIPPRVAAKPKAIAFTDTDDPLEEDLP
jgi:hypothetical protein